MKAFTPLIKNSYRRLTHPSPVPVRFFAQNKGGAPPKGNFPQQGKPNQKPQQPQQQQPKQPFQQPKQQQHQQHQQQQPKQQQQQHQQNQQPQQPKSNMPAQQAAAVTAPATLSPEVVKKDLLTLFGKEVEEIKKDEGKTALANEVKKYLDVSGFKIDESEDGSFLLKKSDKNYSIEVSFEQALKEEGDGLGEGEEDFGNEDEMEKDFSEEADEEGEGKDKVNYNAQIHILDKTTQVPKGTFVAEGFVGGDGRLYVESVVISDSISKEDKPSEASLLGLERGPTGPALEFQNLPQNTQDKLYDFLDSLGIDDQMAQFMKAYTQEYIHVKNEIEFYEKFRKLLS